VTAGYALSDSTNVVIATVRVHPVADDRLIRLFTGSKIADPFATMRPLKASIAQMRHFYPDAAQRDVHSVYFVKRCVLQGGQAATLRYEDMLVGQPQKIDLDINMF
jgi:hypothetical protein